MGESGNATEGASRLAVVGTALAVISGVGGLVVSIISLAIAMDAQRSSEMASASSYARLVTIAEVRSGYELSLTITNRSHAPLVRGHLMVMPFDLDADPALPEGWYVVDGYLVVPTLDGCATATVKVNSTEIIPMNLGGGSPYGSYVIFNDQDGLAWKRYPAYPVESVAKTSDLARPSSWTMKQTGPLRISLGNLEGERCE